MDDSWLACDLAAFLVGFFSASLIWLVFYVFRLNQKDLELLAIANEQYIRGFRRGQKSSQFTPIAPTDSNI
jgi:hypothetical protein